MHQSQKTLLIWNPVAGISSARRRDRVMELADALRDGGREVDTATTDEKEGALHAAREGIAKGFSLLVACGGDGTLSQVVNAVLLEANPASRPAVTLAPLGTANVFAEAVGCPRRPRELARWIQNSIPTTVPVGRAVRNGSTQYFIALGSVGLDARAVHQVVWKHKRRWGKLAYVYAAVREWLRFRPGAIDITVNGTPTTADGFILSLTRFYGGRLTLGKVAAGGSIGLLLRGTPWLLPLQALWLVAHRLEAAPGIERCPAGVVTVTTAELPVQLDGEASASTPITFDVVPAALTMLLGPG